MTAELKAETRTISLRLLPVIRDPPSLPLFGQTQGFNGHWVTPLISAFYLFILFIFYVVYSCCKLLVRSLIRLMCRYRVASGTFVCIHWKHSIEIRLQFGLFITSCPSCHPLLLYYTVDPPWPYRRRCASFCFITNFTVRSSLPQTWAVPFKWYVYGIYYLAGLRLKFFWLSAHRQLFWNLTHVWVEMWTSLHERFSGILRWFEMFFRHCEYLPTAGTWSPLQPNGKNLAKLSISYQQGVSGRYLSK